MARFATTEQIAEVAGWATPIQAYQTLFDNQLKALAGYIEAFSPTSGIETRYITGEGRDDENWRGNLLAASLGSKVDVWCLTVTMSQGLPLEQSGVGYFDKPFSIGLDYFYDFEFGTDSNNSESYFNSQVDGFEWILEQIRTCLPDGAEIESWLFRRMIKRFTNASTHIAKGDIALKLSGL